MLWAFRNNFESDDLNRECRKIFVVKYVLDLTAVNEHSSAPASEPHPRRAWGSGSNRERWKCQVRHFKYPLNYTGERLLLR